jgi:hypothetical protein
MKAKGARKEAETIFRNNAGAANVRNTETCKNCGAPYDGESYTKTICGSCQRLAETRKRTMTDGERDCVEFFNRSMGFQVMHEIKGGRI